MVKNRAMKSLGLTVLPGDGVGPEITAAALAVLQAVGEIYGFTWRITHGLIGATAHAETGRSLPVETLQACRSNPAVLLGPVAGGKHVKTVPSNQPRQAVLKLRDWLGSYAAIRPIRSFPGLLDAEAQRAAFDLVLVFDYSSGLYFGRPRGITAGPDGTTATNTMVYTSSEVERVFHTACRVARRREKQVLSVDQSKWLETGRLWANVVEQTAAQYPDVAVSRRDAGHFLYELVNRPNSYDVVVCEMSLGLLIAAVAQGLSGAYAMHPVAYVGGETSVFQPSHGSGPHIAGQGIADPIGMIRAGALLLETVFGESAAARAIETAVDRTLATGTLPVEVQPARSESPRKGITTCANITAAIIGNLPPPVKASAAKTHSGDRQGP
jgi:3-isopropylmalate dehydrogenase